jgi:hypothetical protein
MSIFRRRFCREYERGAGAALAIDWWLVPISEGVGFSSAMIIFL